MGVLKAVGHAFAPPPAQAEDGRDQWPSRTSFVLACMGGCAGMGNLLRYPSVVYNNHGLQWYIPYLMCVFLIAIPVLVLEISIGNAYRGGSVVAYNSINHRLKGTGLAMLYIGFVVGPYFVVNLAWIMTYFRYSFQSPLPWKDDATAFYEKVVGLNPVPKPGEFTDGNAEIASWVQYRGTAVIGETVGWTIFTWFLVWVSIFRGAGLTGRVVYFTMGLPIVVTIILIGRCCSLPNASEGVKLYFAMWRSSPLADGRLWQTACGQVFFSTGVGFGYFTSYASYNQKHSNAVVDSILVVTSNVLFENTAAFAVFGVVGFLGMYPDPENPVGGFSIGFLTLPAAIVEMPAPNLWAVLLFFTLMVLGYSSAFAMLDAVVTLIMDAQPKWNRTLVVTGAVLISFALSIPYCTQFGYYLLTGIDRWTSDVALVFVVWAECVCSMVVYRWQDVVEQVGMPSFALYNFGYFGGQIIGIIIAHTVGAPWGAIAGFVIYILGTVSSMSIGKKPDSRAPRFWGQNVFLERFWYNAFYSGNQLRRDLNVIVGQGKNWSIPVVWSGILRYIAAPALAIVFGFSYPNFYKLRNDPLHVMGFGVGHIALLIIFCGFIMPKWFDVFIPPSRRGEGNVLYGANVAADPEQMEKNAELEMARKHGQEDLLAQGHGSHVHPHNDMLSSSSSNERPDQKVEADVPMEKSAL
ncbi:sodium-dependent noradrenaline transporter [Emericellopsis atlantica]|uniref:Sodium-dependent noradrenaline transporter n=1 Tax=Emericellopsis atlantica TaxID=2614577 RepID=A0A9P8CMM2_9HYPO|nr:sodium-dependent noradrenaline transporter [Emericellopsis atlantica]KAG9252165.1 sodium-dependent noradrenaline transporter [Emericellopsis atlantica]